MSDDDELIVRPGNPVAVRQSVWFAGVRAFKEPMDLSRTDREEELMLRILAVLQAVTPMLHDDAQEGIADCLDANNFDEAAKAVRAMKTQVQA